VTGKWSLDAAGQFTQIHGNDRNLVREAGRKLGLEGTYIPRSYIEQVTPMSKGVCRGEFVV